MAQYIEKSALVAEIEKFYNECLQKAKITDSDYWNAKSDAYRNVLVILNDTLEIKEVDLEKELNNFIEQQKAFVKDDRVVEYDNGDSFNHIYDLEPVAKHFFELGFKAQKREKLGREEAKDNLWHDAQDDHLPEIDREVIAIIQDWDDAGICRVVFAHRPNPEGWDGKSVLTGEVSHYEPQTYDKGGWNIPDVKFWLDLDLPKLE